MNITSWLNVDSKALEWQTSNLNLVDFRSEVLDSLSKNDIMIIELSNNKVYTIGFLNRNLGKCDCCEIDFDDEQGQDLKVVKYLKLSFDNKE